MGRTEQAFKGRFFPVIFLLVGKAENATAELTRPETVLIYVREKLWYFVFQSFPNNASGASGCHRGSAKFALCAFSERSSADLAPRCCPLAC